MNTEAACPVCPYGLSERCEGYNAAAPGAREVERAIGCFDPARQIRYFRDLHGADFEETDGESPLLTPLPPLPAFIPVLVRVMPKEVSLPQAPLYGVSYSTVLRANGRVRYATPGDLYQQIGLPGGSGLCLLGATSDARLERAWAESEVHGLWDRLEGLGFAFVTTTTFSAWEQQPRFDQIYSQERNLYSYRRFARLGMPTVPFLFYLTPRDLEVAVDWLGRHPEVEVVGILAQFYRRTEDFERLLGGMQVLSDEVDRELRFLVTGCSTAAKIEKLFERFPGASVASTTPVMQALHGRATTRDLKHEKAPRETPRHELVVANVTRFLDFCQTARPLSALPA